MTTTSQTTMTPLASSLATRLGAVIVPALLLLGGCESGEDFGPEDEQGFDDEDDQLRASGVCEVVPLHQYFSLGALDHRYTMDWTELNRGAGSGGYSWQGIEGYGCANADAVGTTALYEYVRTTHWPNINDTNHFYSTTYYGLHIADPVQDYDYVGIVGYVYGTNSSGRKALKQYYAHDVSGTGQRDHFYTTNPNPWFDPAWGYGGPTTQGYLNDGHGVQEVPIGWDYNRVLNFYSLPFDFQLWYPSNSNHSIYERCADSSSPDYQTIYSNVSRNFVNGKLPWAMASGNQCYVREVGVHAAGEWHVRYVSYEGPVNKSY